MPVVDFFHPDALLRQLRAYAAFLLLACFAIPAGAQTSINGVVASDAKWTLSGSPYIVSGDLVVQNGATLNIDPGVTIYMAQDASLSVQAGTVLAMGTAASPIRVLSDKARLGAAPAAGDWKQWVFTAGAVNSRLEHVIIEHGRGMAINGSSPVLNYVDIRNQLGAAITSDLLASPSGVGNRASGNTLNGIAVPAGDITGNVKWALRGIPYVVEAGTISIGASPVITNAFPRTLQQGESITLEITGSRLAGLASASFSTPGLTVEVLPGGSATKASLSVSADRYAVLGASELRLVVDAGEVRLPSALTVEQFQPVPTSLVPSTLYAGQGAVNVAVNGRNMSSGTQVLVNGVAVPTQFVSASQLSASITAPAAAANLAVRLRTPDPGSAGQYLESNELLLPVVPAQISVTPSPATVVLGSRHAFVATLPFKAPAGGISLDVVSSVPGVASVPATVLVPDGQSAVSFDLAANGLGNTVVTVSKAGFNSGQSQVAVVPPPTLKLNPSSLLLGVGRSAEVMLESSAVAGEAGLVINIGSSNADVAAAPSPVTIAPGARSATIVVAAKSLGNATLTASAEGYESGSASVSVRPVSLNMSSGVLVGPGLSRSVPVTLSDPAPAGGLAISLASSNPSVATVPASITVPEGETSANFTLSGVAAGTSSIEATASGYESATTTATVESISILIGEPTVSSISIPEGVANKFAVRLSKPAPAGGVTVNLSTASGGTATVAPASVTIPEGQTSGGSVVATVTGALKGATTLSATAPGLVSTSLPLTVTGRPTLYFSRSTVTAGKGFNTYFYDVRVYAKTDSSYYYPKEPLTVSLISADTSKVRVPATVTIPAGQYHSYFSVGGQGLTGTTSVLVDAQAAGFNSPSGQLVVRVIEPVFSFSDLESARSPVSVRDDFWLTTYVPGAISPYSQSATADIVIDLSVVDASPAGIVDAFYSASSGGVPVSQVVIRAGNTSSYSAYVGTPTTAGSYKVQASSPGVATSISPLVTVSAPELQFSKSSVVVGKDMKTYLYEVFVARAANGALINGADPLTVNLSSSDESKVSVPATVTIPAGTSHTYFYVTGVGPTEGVPVAVDASAEGYKSPSTKLATTVRFPEISFYNLDAKRTPASARDDFFLYFLVPGSWYSSSQTAAVDIVSDLAVIDASPAGIVDGFHSSLIDGVPVTQITLRKGQTQSETRYVGTPSGAGSYKVQVSGPGILPTSSATVTVSPPELRFSKAGIVVGKGLNTYEYEFYLYRAANGEAFNGTNAVTVSLSSADPSKVIVPATVTIPAGQSQVRFYVTGVDMTNGVPVLVDATAEGYSAPATKLSVNVVAPQISFYSLDTNRSPASARDDFYLYFTVPGAYYSASQTAAQDTLVDLEIADATSADVVDGFYSALTGGAPVTQVLLKKGYTSSNTVYVGTPGAAGSYRVRAAMPGQAPIKSGLVSVSMPDVGFSRSNVIVGAGMDTYYYEVSVHRTANGTTFAGTSAVTVNLTCNSTAICTVPASVTIPAGAASAYFKVRGVGPGSTTVSASAVGYNSAPDMSVSTITPQLVFSGLENTRVGSTDSFTVYANVQGATYSSSQTAVTAMPVNLTSSSPGVATVPATVQIRAGATFSDTVTLSGVSAGTTTITASGSGLGSVTSGTVTINP